MSSLRTPETKKKYQDYLDSGILNDGCPLCSKAAIQTFVYWKVTNNDFPYDQIAKVHHMLVPLRHVTEEELNKDEQEEYTKIKNAYLHEKYDWILEAMPKNKTIPDHFHVHLLVGISSKFAE